MPDQDRQQPPGIAPEALDVDAYKFATAVNELKLRDVKLGDRITVTVATEPPFVLTGRIVAATPYVLVISDETTRHRLPWSRVACISTTTAPAHPGL